MDLLFFAENPQPKYALLIKSSAFTKYEIQQNYVGPLENAGIPARNIVAVKLPYKDGKAPAKFAREYLADVLPGLQEAGVEVLYCADANYFKPLVKAKKAAPLLGQLLPVGIKGCEALQATLGINHHALIYNPAQEESLEISLQTLIAHHNNQYQALGADVLKKEAYAHTVDEARELLKSVFDAPYLAVDIEAFSLQKHKAGIATITFATSQHEGIALRCDYDPLPEPEDGMYGRYVPNHAIRHLLKQFFIEYKGELRWHRANYDLGVIVYTLWMNSPTDYAGLLEGLEVMTRPGKWHDTRLIAYLALNNTGRADLSLKTLARPHAGNWAQEEINDIRRIPLNDLLRYNLVDGVCTNYVFDTYYPKMVEENQRQLYDSLFLPSQKSVIQIELVGLPMIPEEVAKLRHFLEQQVAECIQKIQNHPAYQEATYIHRCRLAEKANAKLVKLRKTADDFADEVLNINSGEQLAILLHEVMGLPIIETTATGLPATGGDIIEALKNHTDQAEDQEVLDALLVHAKAVKILSSFVPAFERSVRLNNGYMMLQGSFNMGGTVSGRMSSSDPNLQNIPSGSDYGKAVKKCFAAPPGWVFGGADFNSLEDYISALTTKDPNKLKVYLDGYDGHSLRAYSYFKDQMPDIEDTVESINSIKKKYDKLRSKSKGPTFALTYQGTWITLVKNLGFSEEEARRIEANYHQLYKVSDEYVQQRLLQAQKDGYVEVAFGLKVRTPLLSKSLVPYYQAGGLIAKEGRTAGNALGQSYGLLTNRAMNAFMEKVWAHPKMRLNVLPVAMIHDALYFLIRDDVEVVEWVNTHLIEEMRWQELPEIQHDKVKLGAALDLFWPDWAHPITLPNDASAEEIRQVVKTELEKRKHAESDAT